MLTRWGPEARKAMLGQTRTVCEDREFGGPRPSMDRMGGPGRADRSDVTTFKRGHDVRGEARPEDVIAVAVSG